MDTPQQSTTQQSTVQPYYDCLLTPSLVCLFCFSVCRYMSIVLIPPRALWASLTRQYGVTTNQMQSPLKRLYRIECGASSTLLLHSRKLICTDWVNSETTNTRVACAPSIGIVPSTRISHLQLCVCILFLYFLASQQNIANTLPTAYHILFIQR